VSEFQNHAEMDAAHGAAPASSPADDRYRSTKTRTAAGHIRTRKAMASGKDNQWLVTEREGRRHGPFVSLDGLKEA
jgi:hypothetical protein